MRLRWLISLGGLLSLAALVNGDEVLPTSGKNFPALLRKCAGYLLAPRDDVEGIKGHRLVPYHPQPGDILLYDRSNKFHHLACRVGGTDAPIHAAIVIGRDDGSTAILDLTGPLAITARVVIVDVEERLSSYPGTIMVRQLRQPLTPDQSHALTCFAHTQVGKKFAMPRILLYATPFSPRKTPCRTLFAHTYLNRNRWFCSEMVVAAGTTAQVFDPSLHHANTTYPRDLAFDETMDLSTLYHPAVSWVPARMPNQTAQLVP